MLDWFIDNSAHVHFYCHSEIIVTINSTFPKFLKDYMEDFGDEKELLAFVLKYSQDRAISMERVMEDYESKELTLIYDQLE